MSIPSVSLLAGITTNLTGSVDLAGQSIQEYATQYLQAPNATSYGNLVNQVFNFLRRAPTAQTAAGLRVQLILADGTTAIDTGCQDTLTASQNVHLFANIGNADIPVDGVFSSSCYRINENQGTRSYNQGAALSQSGVFSQIKHSNSTGTKQYYLASRIGTLNEPLGIFVVSMNTV